MSLRPYFQHILRTLLCIGAIATLFCQQSHAVTGNDGRDYFFIQFVNIDESNDCRFVRARWPHYTDNPNGVELGRMQNVNETQNLGSDAVGFWRWDGDLLVCYSNNRFLCYDANTQKYAVTPNRNQAVPMETFTDTHGNLKLRRKGQTESEMGFNNPHGEGGEFDVVDVPSTGNAQYAIGTSTTYEEALSYQNETVSDAFYIRFFNRSSSNLVVVTDQGVGNTLTMTPRGNNPNTDTDDAKNRLWRWVNGKYLRNLQDHYIYLDGTELKTTLDKTLATRFRIYYNSYARPLLRLLDSDGNDTELTVGSASPMTENAEVVVSTGFSNNNELELVDYFPIVGQKYFIRFTKDPNQKYVHEMGFPDTYNGNQEKVLCESSGFSVGGTKINGYNMISYTPNMRSLTWTLENGSSEGQYRIKSDNGLYIGPTVQMNWGGYNRPTYTVKNRQTDAADMIVRQDGNHNLTLTHSGFPDGAFNLQGNNTQRYIQNERERTNTHNNDITNDNETLEFIRNDAPLPQDVPAMEDGHWYKLSFGGVQQTLIKAHVDTDGYYTLEHDKGRYVYWNGTALAYTTNASLAAKFEIRAERKGWHLERVSEGINLKVVVATGNEFKEVYQSRNADNTKAADTWFSFEEFETEHPTMLDGHWYRLSFGGTEQTLVRAHVISDGVYTLEHDLGRYVHWNGTSFEYITDASQATTFIIRAELSGFYLSLNSDPNSFKVVTAKGNTFSEVNNTTPAANVFSFEEFETEHPAMLDGQWYRLSFGGTEQTLVRAHVISDGVYTLEHDLGRYVRWNGTSFEYTIGDSQATPFIIRAELSGFYLSLNSDPNSFKVVIASGDSFTQQDLKANPTTQQFSFVEETVDLTKRPTMDCNGWYELYFHDVPICARKAICDGVDAAGNKVYKLKYGSQYLKYDTANSKYVTTGDAAEAARFTVTLGLGGWQLTRLTDDNNFYGGYTIATKGTTNRTVTFTETKYPNKPTSWFGIEEIPAILDNGTKYVFYFENMQLYGMYDLEMESGKDCDLIGNAANYGGMAWTALQPDGGDGNTDFYYRFQNEFGRYIKWNDTTKRYQVTNSSEDAAQFIIDDENGVYGYMLKRFGTDNVFLPGPGSNNTFTEKARLKANGTSNLSDNEMKLAAIYFREVTSNDAWFDDSTEDLEILHRPSFFQERANELGSGTFPHEFLQPGSGMTERTLADGTTTIRTQNTPEYRLTRYVRKGDFVGLYLTTSRGTSPTRHNAYQRLYLYDTDKPLTHKYFMPFNDNDAYVYKNGLVMGNALTNSDGVNLSKKTTNNEYSMFAKLSLLGRLPTDENQVTIACDLCYDKSGDNYKNDLSYANGSATTAAEGGNLTEPTLSLRQIWTLIDAKVMANELVTKTGDNWLEERTIHFSNKTQGLTKEYIPLSNDLENYWIYKNYTGTDKENECTDENLVQVGQVILSSQNNVDADRYYVIKTTDHGSGIQVDLTLPKLPQTTDVGNYVTQTVYKRRRHISFNYPESRKVPAGSSIDIMVYAVDADGDDDADGNKRRYNIAKFTLIFDAGTETLPYMDIVGNTANPDYSERSPEALRERCGEPKAYLNFDYHHEYGFTSPTRNGMDDIMAALPLDYATTNYAYARRITSNKWDTRIAAGWGSSGVGNIHKNSIEVGESNVNGVNQRGKFDIKSVSDYTGIRYSNEFDPGFLFVDASDMPGQVATVSFEGDFCEGSLLMCSGWMASVDGGYITTDNNGNETVHSPGSVILTVMGRKYDADDNLISEDVVYSFCPGQLPYYARRADRPLTDGPLIYPKDNKKFGSQGDCIWQQFYFEFYGDGSDDYYLKIDNNATSTEGGDYMLDDIWIFAVLPELEAGSTLPLCGGELEFVQLENKYESLLNAVGFPEYGVEGYNVEHTGYLSLTYIDWDKFVHDFKVMVEGKENREYTQTEFLKKLEEGGFLNYAEDPDYKNIFSASLMREGANGTGKVAYSNIEWSNNFDSHQEYSFSRFCDDNDYGRYNKVYRFTDKNDVRKLIFNGRMNIGSFEYYHNYRLLATLRHQDVGAIADSHIPQFYSIFNVLSTCSFSTDLYMKPFVEVDGTLGVQDLDEISHCLNSIETLKVDLKILRYNTETNKWEEVGNPNPIYFDWWVGTKDVAATVNNFYAQHHGTEVSTTENARLYGYDPADPDYFTLENALKSLRYNYPNATQLEGLVPANNDIYNVKADDEDDEGIKVYELTEAKLLYLKELVTPSTPTMPQLYLHSKTVNVMLDEENFKVVVENGNKYIYICTMPIELDVNQGSQGTTFTCSEPQPIKVKVDEVAPHIDLGFADKKYPDQLDLLSVRLAKSQFEHVNIRNNKNVTEDKIPCLHIPLRNVTSPSANADGIENVGIRADGVNGDVILLTATTDTEMENYLLEHYENDNAFNGVKVGTITYLYGTKGNTEELASEALAFYFDEDFKVREGYSYTLKFPFTERFEAGAEVTTRCEGFGAFIVKIVPDYEVWTERTGNIDWSNDNNWRRASRAELYADNGTTLKESYLDNGHVDEDGEIVEPASTYDENNTPILPLVNYITAEDRQRMQGFAPLYCTNILMLNKETADAPELYDDGPEVINGVATGFPALHSTASPMIRYDFQGHEWPNLKKEDGTPDYSCNEENPKNNQSNPYSNDPQKMVRKAGDIVTELYSTNQCGGIVFQSKTELVNTHLLNYKKAWVEFELPQNKWHLVSSPLQGTISGEWYAPTWSGRQETTYFEPIQFDVKPVSSIKTEFLSESERYPLDYDRFAPAVYQRQWDKARAVLYERGAVWKASDAAQDANNDQSQGGQWSPTGQGYEWSNNQDEYLNRLVYKPFDVSKVNVAVRGSWSGAHNDHRVPYDNGGFSIMPINNLKPIDTMNPHYLNENTIFRLPKDDQYYDIWDWTKGYVIDRRVRVYINDGNNWPLSDETKNQMINEWIERKLQDKIKAWKNEHVGEEPDDNTIAALRSQSEQELRDNYLPNDNNVITLNNRGRLRSDYFVTPIATPTAEDPNAVSLPEAYEVTLKNEGQGSMGYFLASNPFICGLDMVEFFRVNTNLEPYYLVLNDSEIVPSNNNSLEAAYTQSTGTTWKWTDMSFAYYNGLGNTIVPPRYAFFVKTKTAQNEVILEFTTDMMVSTPKTTTTGGGAPCLRIKAERDGNNSEATVMISSEASNKFVPGEDMETFVVSDISSKIPVIYTLTGHLATSINRIHDFMVLPIGIESNSDELVNVTFEGVENLSDSLMLYDTMTEELLPLKSGTTTQMPGRTQNRFYIVKGENLQETIEESSLQITANNGRITVTSTTNQPITDVRVYDAGGRQVYEATPNRTKHRFSLLEGTYVVKAKTDSIQQTKKVHN